MLPDEIVLAYHKNTCVVLAREPDGRLGMMAPQPLLFRACYANDPKRERSMAANQLAREECWIFYPLPSPDGPPHRSGLLYTHMGTDQESYPSVHGHLIASDRCLHFSPVTTRSQWTWRDDCRRGIKGYFLFGADNTSSAWRVFRLEGDAWGRQVFTLTPVQFSGACLPADFTSIREPLLREEVEKLYLNLAESERSGAYYATITTAKNIVEAILKSDFPSANDLMAALNQVRAELNQPNRQASRYCDLTYHLAHKIRILHARTHPDRIMKTGRRVREELAMTVIEDLNEILLHLGFVKE